MLRGRPEDTWLRLTWLHIWCVKRIERVLTHWPWLVCPHSHSHAHTHAAHALHSAHALHATHCLHAPHGLLATHRLEGHRLETSRCGWLLDRTKGVGLGLLATTTHHLAERVRPWQLLLCLELVWLLCTTCSCQLTIVKALKHGKFVVVGQLRWMWSQRLVSLSKDVS